MDYIDTSSTASAFRRGNEIVADRIAIVTGDSHSPVAFVCECSDSACLELVHLTLAQYRRLRDTYECFLTVRGHTVADARLDLDADVSVWRAPRAAHG